MTKRIGLFITAIIAIGALAGSTRASSALDLNRLDPGYVACMKYATIYANRYPEGEQRAIAYAKLRQNCDNTYSSKRLNLD